MRLLDHTPYNLRWLIINIQTTILNTNLIGNKRLLHSLSIDHAKVDDLDFLAKLNDIENLKLTDMDLRYIDTSPLLTLHGLKDLFLVKVKSQI